MKIREGADARRIRNQIIVPEKMTTIGSEGSERQVVEDTMRDNDEPGGLEFGTDWGNQCLIQEF